MRFRNPNSRAAAALSLWIASAFAGAWAQEPKKPKEIKFCAHSALAGHQDQVTCISGPAPGPEPQPSALDNLIAQQGDCMAREEEREKDEIDRANAELERFSRLSGFDLMGGVNYGWDGGQHEEAMHEQGVRHAIERIFEVYDANLAVCLQINPLAFQECSRASRTKNPKANLGYQVQKDCIPKDLVKPK